MKRMSKQSIVDSEHQQRVILEKNALQAMTSCPFIIRLLGTYQDESSVYFLSDVVMGGDLMSYMIDQDILKNEEAQVRHKLFTGKSHTLPPLTFNLH